VDRDTGLALGDFAQAIDDTLYDAFGQRQCPPFSRSSISTRSARRSAELQKSPEALKDIYVKSNTGAQR